MTQRRPIDFPALAAALLQRADVLVPQWMPGGRRQGHEWVCGDLSGGEGRSCSVNLVTGRWSDFSFGDDEKGNDLISLYAAIHGLSQAEAARQLMRQLGWSHPEEDDERRARVQAPGRQPAAPDGDGRPEPPPEDPDADAKTKRKREPKWRALLPVPPHAPKPDFLFGYRDEKRGGAWVELEAVRTWEYRFEGELHGYVARFERVDSEGELVKETIARTWCVDESDGRGLSRWHWKQWEAPRPLYVPATLLSGTPDLVPVVIVEGEKCAEAGLQLLGHEFDFVSWPGGAKAWAKANWQWLMGRKVILWPDCDAQRVRLTKAERDAGVAKTSKPLLPEAKQPGMAAMIGIGSLLLAEHACTVQMCRIPTPDKAPGDGWDIADAIASGWTADQVRDFLLKAPTFVAPDDAARAKAGKSTASTASAGEGGKRDDGDDVDRSWRSHLLASVSTGAIKSVRENVVLALDGWPEKGVLGAPECMQLIRFNEFSNNVEKTRPTPWGTPAGDWLEADELMMGDWLVRELWLPSMSRQALEEAVVVVARRHSYHPVRERFEGLRGQWDGCKRLDTWLRRVCLEEDEFNDAEPLQQYLTLAGRWFLMGMVARVMTPRFVGKKQQAGPGVKFDYMLVLEGPTGWGKSTLASVLGGEHFADTGLDVMHKDSLMNIQGILVYEWSELDQMAKQDLGGVKRFISSPTDRFRATFDRRPAKYPRQVVFVGTTEEANYLLDHKGNRRFWPVRLTRQPDNDWLRENLEQMLAEAVHLVDADARYWPTPQEQRELFDPQQSLRKVESPIEAAIRSYLYDEQQKVHHGTENGTLVNRISLQQLLARIGYTIDKQTDAVAKKASSVLHMLGWEVVGRPAGLPGETGRPRVYGRPSPDPLLRPEASPRGSESSSSPQHDAAALTTGGRDDCPF